MAEQNVKREWVERDGKMFLKVITQVKNIRNDEFVDAEEQEHETQQTREQVIAGINGQIAQLQSEVTELETVRG